MTLEEKLAQLVGLWLQLDDSSHAGGDIAPMQHEMLSNVPDFDTFTRHGLGQLTRPLGSQRSTPEQMMTAVDRVQESVTAHSRFDIPALVHEEILTGLQLFGAATYPTPLAWGSTWDTELITRMGEQIGSSMKAMGIHLGLAPVLDVVRDPRWGRVEECIAEDPYLVGVIGSAYVVGVQSQGVGATLKHFLGYSNSQAGRNLAPVHAGPREILEVFSVPFEMAVKLARPHAVMHSYAEIDGVPVAADKTLLTGLLRDRWGFDGTVVADYFGVAFLHTLHDVASSIGDAAALALIAGVDVELPTGNAYLEPLADQVRQGLVPIDVVDTAVRRVLRQKQDLSVRRVARESTKTVDLDPPSARAVAQQIAEKSVVLLANSTGLLPLNDLQRIALIGPNADSAEALMGNYSFTNHVEAPPGASLGIDVPTIFEALAAEVGDHHIRYAIGCELGEPVAPEAGDDPLIAEAVDVARASDVCVVVVGDRAGLFGRGTVGEGSDAELLELPGRQQELVDALIATGTPVILVLVTGRPYPVGRWEEQAAAIVQSFFPGEEGGSAIAGVISGRVNPSGRLPVSIPKRPGGQPYNYRHPRLGGPTPISNIDPSPAFAFGHGLTYTTFHHANLEVAADGNSDTASTITVTCSVYNKGDRQGSDVVQLYVHDVAASVTRPLRQLIGWARVDLPAGASAAVRFTVHTDRLGLVNRDLNWVVEPGEFEFTIASSATAEGLSRRLTLRGSRAFSVRTDTSPPPPPSPRKIGDPHALRRKLLSRISAAGTVSGGP
ncbi:glycoside hydrolase family 3 N-terminal domain-containing protein [Frondihabitans sucicola]|nr:glycoside hydrolase family 3 N-terminal domain-containing protein [Frondihabitans sucicola]